MIKSMVEDILQEVSAVNLERDHKKQILLNIENRRRTSFFPWRGQFSPQLIEHFLVENAKPGFRILDPFCGSGTTLYEAARKGLYCYGADVNPAAYIFSSIVGFSNLDRHERQSIFRTIRKAAQEHFCYLSGDLFSLSTQENEDFLDDLLSFQSCFSADNSTQLLIDASIMMAMGDTDNTTRLKFIKSLELVLNITDALPYSDRKCNSLLADARSLDKIPDSSIDLVITSPPYINVFNYHQNYRKAVEILGWQPLKVAVSEIGANRKYRSNRFFTVIQYCMDMCQAFIEMRRVLQDDGKIVIVVGRTSSVRGISFQNGLLLGMVSSGCAGYSINKWEERCFTNRFGEKIYEDILTLRKQKIPASDHISIAHSIGLWALDSSLHLADGEVRYDIEQAIKGASKVHMSPKLNFEFPFSHKPYFFG